MATALSRPKNGELRHVGNELAILAGTSFSLAHPSVQSFATLATGRLKYCSCNVQGAGTYPNWLADGPVSIAALILIPRRGEIHL